MLNHPTLEASVCLSIFITPGSVCSPGLQAGRGPWDTPGASLPTAPVRSGPLETPHSLWSSIKAQNLLLDGCWVPCSGGEGKKGTPTA